MKEIRSVSTGIVAALIMLLLLPIALIAQAQGPSPRPGKKATGKPGKAASKRPVDPAQTVHKHVSIRADHVIHGEHRTIARGHAVALTEGAYIEGDEIEVDHDNDMLYARKNVVVRMVGDEVHAEAAKYDLKTGVADLQDAFGIARNITLYHNSIEDALYFWSPRIRWDGTVLKLIKGTVTTCDLPLQQQHYKITGNVINVYPNDRMEIRKARVFYEGKQVIGRELIVFSLHQRKRQNSIIPQVGYNNRDGLSIRESIPFSLNPGTYGRLMFDYFGKSGFAHGLEMIYGLGDKGYGTLFYYDLAARKQHQGRYEFHNFTTFRLSPTLSAAFSYQGDRYDSTNPQVLTPTSKVFAASLSDAGPRHQLSISSVFYNSGVINNTFLPINNQFFGLLYRQNFTDRLTNSLEISYQTSQYDVSHSYFLHALDRLSYRAPLFDSDLLLEKTAFTGTPIFLVNRLPEVQVRSRLFNLGPVPFRLSVGVGRLEEQPSGTSVGRADLKFAIPDTYFPLGERGSVLVGAGVRQLYYDNGDAQYQGALRADLIQDWDNHWRTHLDYRLQRGAGYTPIQSDYFGQYNSISGGVEFHDRDRFYMGVETGRDFLYNRNYDLRARMMVKPWKDFSVDLGTNIDIDLQKPMQFDSRVKLPLSPTLSVQYYGLYDFYNNRIAFQDFMIQNESHDFLTSLIYRGVQKELFLQVSLKSFPFQIPSVGPSDSQPVLPRVTTRGFRPDALTPTSAPTPLR